jgi:hypothetical protein
MDQLEDLEEAKRGGLELVELTNLDLFHIYPSFPV